MDFLYLCSMFVRKKKNRSGSVSVVVVDKSRGRFREIYQFGVAYTEAEADALASQAQIVLGLLVSQDGYPLSYSIFNGSQYEGYTMIPIVDNFVQRFSLKDFVIVADSGLMSAKNMKLLRSAGYKYIVGARIKTERTEVRDWILSLEKKNGAVYEHQKDDGDRLVVSYSAARAANDAKNRDKGVARLEKAYCSGTYHQDFEDQPQCRQGLGHRKDNSHHRHQDRRSRRRL